MNKRILVVFAAGKASYFPEFIPDNYLKNKSLYTNYSVYKVGLKKWGIPYIDYLSWFNQLKNTTPYPLYSKCGIHWSKYAESLVADSLINFLSQTMHLKLGKLKLDTLVVSEDNLYEDYDIGNALNLARKIKTFSMVYPSFHYDHVDSIHNNKVMVVADSYYWGMYNSGLSNMGFNGGQFWFYNNQIYSKEYSTPINVSEVEILDEMKKHDVIIIMNTETNLSRFGRHFIENMYDAFFVKNSAKSSVKKIRLHYYINQVKQSEDMMQRCKASTIANQSTMEQEIKKFAEYLLWKENAKLDKLF